MIKITTLGEFLIKKDEKIISNDNKRTKKLWKLLNILILNRNKPLSLQILSDYIWSEERGDLSNKAVHNLVFRLRNILSAKSNDSNYILFINNGYMLNKNIIIDAYEMEDCCMRAISENINNDEKIKLFENAVKLYNGDYFINLYDDIWTLTAVNHYKRIFIDSVVHLSDLYLENNLYNKVIEICEKAISLEPIEEAVYIRLIKSMMCKGQVARAIFLCEEYFRLLYKEVGIHESKQIHKLYMELKGNTFSPENDIYEKEIEYNKSDIDIEMKSIENKAFFCSPNVFKYIYMHEIRCAQRKNIEKETLVVLLNIKYEKNNGISHTNILNEAKKHLYESCLYSLRKSDVFSNYSNSQFVLLLLELEFKDHVKIMERIKRHFYMNWQNEQQIIIDFKVKLITSDWLINLI